MRGRWFGVGGLVGATKANSSGLPRGTEGVNVGGRACVLVHVERAERESGLMADIWHPVPPVWVLQPRTPSRPLTERRDRPLKIGTLPRSKPPRTPRPLPAPPAPAPRWCGQGEPLPAAPSPVNVPICFPKCSEEEFIAVFCGSGQKLIKCLFFC